MKKLFFLLAVFSFSAIANDQLANSIYSFCERSGGSIQYEPTASVDQATGQVCVTSACAIDSRAGGGTCDININSETIPSGCARAVLKKCGTVTDNSQGGRQGGSQSGSQSGAQSGSQGGSQSGSQSGQQGGGDTRVGGGSSDRDGGFYCEDFGGMMYDDHPCYRHV